MEEALRTERDSRAFQLPRHHVDFSKTEVPDVGRITTMDAPHRVFDAIIRDSQLKGVAFKDTADGKRLVQAKSSNATALFELSPTALVFGAWNSTGEGGGLGAKFRARSSPRSSASASRPSQTAKPSGQRTGSRIDPLGIRASVRVYKNAKTGEWTLEKPAKGTKDISELRPSEINHSNIAPTVSPLGVSIDYALHTLVCPSRRYADCAFPERTRRPRTPRAGVSPRWVSSPRSRRIGSVTSSDPGASSCPTPTRQRASRS